MDHSDMKTDGEDNDGQPETQAGISVVSRKVRGLPF